MAKKIGAIAVNLTANSAAFSRDLNKARTNLRSNSARMNKSLSKLERSFGKVQRSSSKMLSGLMSWKTVVGTLVGTGGLGILIKNSLDAADAISKASDVTGIHASKLQEYQHAARLSGVDTELLNKSFAAFTKRLGEARQGTGPLITYLKKFDTQLLDNIRSAGSTEQALDLIFKRMGSLSSAADKAALANAAFSRSGLKIAIMTKAGYEGLSKMTKEARDLGIVLNDVDKAAAANDAILRFSSVIKTTFTQTVIDNADTLTASMGNLTKMAVKAADAFSQLSKWMFDREVGVEMFDTIAKTAIEANKKMLASLEKQLKIEERLGSIHSEHYAYLQRQIELKKQTIAMGQKELALSEKMDAHVKAWQSRPTFDDSGADPGTADTKPAAKYAREASRIPKDFWQIQAAERQEVNSRMYDVLIDQEKQYIAAGEAMGKDMWLIKAEDMAKMTESAADSFKVLDNRIDLTFSSAADAISDFATTGKLNFSDFTNSLISDLIRMQARMSMMSLFKSLPGLLSFGGAANGVMAGGAGSVNFGFDSGGHIGEPITGIGLRSGQSYEFHANETVIPDNKLGGGGTNVVINNYSGQPATQRQAEINGRKTIMVDIGNDILSGGPVAQAVGMRFGFRPVGRGI